MTDSKAGIVTNYDAATIYLLWLTAILIIALWLIAMTDDWFPRGPLRDTVKSLHVVLGFAAVFVTAARIVWRSSFGLRLPPASSGFLYLAGEAVHYLLLVLLVAALDRNCDGILSGVQHFQPVACAAIRNRRPRDTPQPQGMG